MTDSTHSVSVSNGNKLNFAVSVGAGGSSSFTGNFYCISARFDSTDTTTASAQLIGCEGPTEGIAQSGIVQPVCFLGSLSDGTLSEETQQVYALVSGTWQNMACYIQGNTTTDGSIIITNRINGSPGLMAIPVGRHPVTGYFEDTSHSDTVAVTDLINYGSHSPGGVSTGSIVPVWIGAHFLSDDATLSIIGGSPGSLMGALPVIDAAVTSYSSLFGGGLPSATDNPYPEDRTTGTFPYALTASSHTNYLPCDQTQTASATFTLLIEAARPPLPSAREGFRVFY